MNDLHESDYDALLEYFFTEFVHVTRDLLDIDLKISKMELLDIPKLENTNDLLALLDFRGSSIGFLSIQCNQETLKKLSKQW